MMMDDIRNAVKVWNEEGDKRAMNWFLLRTPAEVLGVIGFYVVVAKVKFVFLDNYGESTAPVAL